MTTINELQIKAKQLMSELEDVQNEIKWKQSQIRAEVTLTKIGDAYILQHDGRTIKVRPVPPFGRFRVTEGRKTLIKESLYSINQIRLNFAMGRI